MIVGRVGERPGGRRSAMEHRVTPRRRVPARDDRWPPTRTASGLADRVGRDFDVKRGHVEARWAWLQCAVHRL